MKRTPLLVAISLLLTACVAMASYLMIYHRSYEIEYDELDFDEYKYTDGVLTVRVKADTTGEYLYRVIAVPNSQTGEVELTFRGGKQKELAQTAGSVMAKFEIEIPAGTSRVVCGESTVYTIK